MLFANGMFEYLDIFAYHLQQNVMWSDVTTRMNKYQLRILLNYENRLFLNETKNLSAIGLKMKCVEIFSGIGYVMFCLDLNNQR